MELEKTLGCFTQCAVAPNYSYQGNSIQQRLAGPQSGVARLQSLVKVKVNAGLF